MPDATVTLALEKQHYGITANNGGTKVCHYTKNCLKGGSSCYKHAFYGIASHRCLQMTPVVHDCTLRCLFCWRFKGFKSGSTVGGNDPPELVLDRAIEEHRRLISGYRGLVDAQTWDEAINPSQLAISLTGEPMLYPYMAEFLELAHRRGMTTFLVTNGTLPKAIAKLDTLPTQLYVTVAAPTQKVYDDLLIPVIPHAFANLKETLALLPSLSCRTTIRHTLVEGWNVDYEREYAALDKVAEADFIEPKGYVNVGYSRDHLGQGNMPSHDRIRLFSQRLADSLGYELAGEFPKSRVTLLKKPGTVAMIDRAEFFGTTQNDPRQM